MSGEIERIRECREKERERDREGEIGKREKERVQEWGERGCKSGERDGMKVGRERA